MTIYKVLLMTHALFGALALTTFWTAGLTRKGSLLHRRAGKIYLLAMAVVLSLALPLATSILLQRSSTFGVFLLYLLILTATSVWLSWRAVRDRRNWPQFTGPVYRGLAWLNLLGGATVLAMAVWLGSGTSIIMAAFSLIGIANFVQMRRFGRTAPANPDWWLRQHMNAMIGNGVATHIAFLIIGLPRLLPMLGGPTLTYIAWLGPLIGAAVAGWYLRRKYALVTGAARGPLGEANTARAATTLAAVQPGNSR
jgi:hypothetical protein